jgi:hypothetical protein
MQSEPISLHHQPLLRDRLRAIEIPISEFSFPNLYLFRHLHKYEVLRDGEEVWIRGLSYGRRICLMPTRDLRGVDPDYLSRMAGTADYFYPIPEEWISVFPVDRFEKSFDDGESDYIYQTEKIATFAGKRLHKKKNLLNFFLKHYSHNAEPLTQERLQDALAILEIWQRESGMETSATDFNAAREALERMEELVLCGGIWYAEGRPSGYILGEEITEDTFVLHFAKGLTSYKGIYQYIFSSFASILPGSYQHLNMEQDLGKEALRHSKESYYPEKKLVKYLVSLRNA